MNPSPPSGTTTSARSSGVCAVTVRRSTCALRALRRLGIARRQRRPSGISRMVLVCRCGNVGRRGVITRRSRSCAGTPGAVVAAVDDEVVALRLAADRFVDAASTAARRSSRLPQRCAKIGGVFLSEAHEQRAGAGQPDAVAAFAEIMGQRRDEAEPPAGFAHRRHSAPGRRCGSRSRRASSAAAGWARTSDSGRYWSSRFSPPISPIGMTSMMARSKPSSPHHATSRRIRRR